MFTFDVFCGTLGRIFHCCIEFPTELAELTSGSPASAEGTRKRVEIMLEIHGGCSSVELSPQRV